LNILNKLTQKFYNKSRKGQNFSKFSQQKKAIYLVCIRDFIIAKREILERQVPNLANRSDDLLVECFIDLMNEGYYHITIKDRDNFTVIFVHQDTIRMIHHIEKGVILI
jgi:hypothetical protein